MRNKHVGILLLLLSWAFSESRADHIIGSEISYEFVNTTSLKVFTKVYRNCNECKFNGNGGGSNTSNCNDIGNLEIYGLNKTQNKYVLLGSVLTVRQSIKDLSALCPTEKSACMPNTTFFQGAEQHTFESLINLGTYLSQDYTEFKFGTTIDARSLNISSLGIVQNHFNYCYLNYDAGVINSPFSDQLPFYRVQTNDAIYQNAFFKASNFDSVSYQFDTAYISIDVKNSYPINHSPKIPIEVISGNDYKVFPPKGMYLDNETGQIIFTPNKANDIGALIIECRGFILVNGTMELASIIRKDFECLVVNGSKKSPYFFGLGNPIWNACEGEKVSDDLFYKDIFAEGKNDTVYLRQVNLHPYALNVYHTKQPYAPFRTSNFDWTPPIGSAREKPYQFSFLATDSNCPNPAKSYYTYRIKVNKAKPIIATKTQTDCNSFTFTSVGGNPNDFVRFSMLDSNKKEVPGSAVFDISTNYTFATKGKWFVQLLTLTQGGSCAFRFLDSITLPDFKKPIIELGLNQTICFSTILNLTPTVDIKDYPITIEWTENEQVLGLNSLNFEKKFEENTKVLLEIVDALGCIAKDSIDIKVHPKWNNLFKDTGLCFGALQSFYLPSALLDTGALEEMWFSGLGVSANQFNANGLSKGNYKINLTVRDTFNCIYFDSFNLQIGEPFKISHVPLPQICQFATALNLNSAASPFPSGGNWSFVSKHANWILNDLLQTQLVDSGNFLIRYSVNRNGCSVDSLIPIKILLSPKISLTDLLPSAICQTDIPIIIRTIESPRIILLNGVADSVLRPARFDDSVNVLIRRTHALNSCSNTFNQNIKIDSVIRTVLLPSQNPICFETSEIDLSLSENKHVATWTSFGDGIFNKIADSVYNYRISTVEKQGLVPIAFRLFLESINNCPNKTINISIKQIPKLNLYTDSFIIASCDLGNLKIRVRDRNFTFYDSVQWFLDGIKQANNGFSNNVQYFKNLRSKNYRIDMKPYSDGCTESYDTSFTIYPKPNPVLSASPNNFYSARFPVIYLNVLNYNSTYSYNWQTNPVYEDLDNFNPYKFTMPSDTGIHYFALYTTSDKGCLDTLNYTAICLPKDWIYVPNAFSPNNDGPIQNELFKAEGRITSDYSLEIFDKWGGKLFSSTEINQGWDGKVNGKLMPPTDYIYIIKFIDDIGRPITLKSSFILIY